MRSSAETSKLNTAIIHCFNTQLCADSVEWCPHAPFHQILVLGTYEVVKSDETQQPQGSTSTSSATKRHGRLFLFEVSNSEELVPLQTIDLPAILDMKWCHILVSGKVLLAVATAVGQLLIFELEETLTLKQMSMTELVHGAGKEVLLLSIDWSTGRYKEDIGSIRIVVSDSHGVCSIYCLDKFNLHLAHQYNAHGFEAWIAAFDYWNPSVFYSGGDDCKLCVWDTRVDSSTLQKKILSFDAGVTSIHSNGHYENILACGSYDEKLRIWDTRQMKHPLNAVNLGGGIWRVKWDPHFGQYIIAACMYNGVYMLDCRETLQSQGEIAQIYHSTEHQSIAYGADWCYSNGTDISSSFTCPPYWEDCQTALVATCSFYDKQLHISLINKSIFESN